MDVSKEEVKIEMKYDYELSKTELNQIFILYNDIFYHNRVRKKDLIKKVKEQLGKSNIFQWVLLRELKSNKLIGMGSFIYDYSALSKPNISKFDINESLKENICNIAVDISYRRRGYATLIMEKIISQRKDCLTLEVKKSSENYQYLIKFYKKMGFVEYTETNKSIYMRREVK